MGELTWQSCRALGGPFAAYTWGTGRARTGTSSEGHDRAILAIALVLMLLEIPAAAALYTLARACDARRAREAAGRRAREASAVIDEQIAHMNRREALRAKRAALYRRSSSHSSHSSEDRDGEAGEGTPAARPSRPAPSFVVGGWMANSRWWKAVRGKVREKDVEIAALSAKVEQTDRLLAALLQQRTRSERVVEGLVGFGGDRRRTVACRAAVLCAAALLALLSGGLLALAALAVQARAHCSPGSPLGANATVGLWFAYGMVCAAPAALAWCRVLRSAYHWRAPHPCRNRRHGVIIDAEAATPPPPSRKRADTAPGTQGAAAAKKQEEQRPTHGLSEWQSNRLKTWSMGSVGGGGDAVWTNLWPPETSSPPYFASFPSFQYFRKSLANIREEDEENRVGRGESHEA